MYSRMNEMLCILIFTLLTFQEASCLFIKFVSLNCYSLQCIYYSVDYILITVNQNIITMSHRSKN